MKMYEYDFAESLGDTILEKYESLLNFLVEINKETKINYAITHPSIASMFETTRVGFNPTPMIVQMGEMYYCGNLNYPHSKIDFELFKSGRLAENELILCSMSGSSIISFKNFM